MTSLPRKAMDFAIRSHGSQKYGEHPYRYHLRMVVQQLVNFGIQDPDLLAAGWVHDVLEDTPVTREELAAATNPEVARLAWAVSKHDVPGKTRREKSGFYLEKILQSGKKAIWLKLADRIANVKECWEWKNSKLFMYHREYKAFRKVLRDEEDEVALPMWDLLDRLLGWWEPGK